MTPSDFDSIGAIAVSSLRAKTLPRRSRATHFQRRFYGEFGSCARDEEFRLHSFAERVEHRLVLERQADRRNSLLQEPVVSPGAAVEVDQVAAGTVGPGLVEVPGRQAADPPCPIAAGVRGVRQPLGAAEPQA